MSTMDHKKSWVGLHMLKDLEMLIELFLAQKDRNPDEKIGF
jgi:hypothetical protein